MEITYLTTGLEELEYLKWMYNKLINMNFQLNYIQEKELFELQNQYELEMKTKIPIHYELMIC